MATQQTFPKTLEDTYIPLSKLRYVSRTFADRPTSFPLELDAETCSAIQFILLECAGEIQEIIEINVEETCSKKGR